MDKDKLIEILLKNVNLKGLAVDVLNDVVEAALTKLVNDTSNPYDNMLKDVLWPLLEAEIIKQVEKLIAGLQPEVPKP